MRKSLLVCTIGACFGTFTMGVAVGIMISKYVEGGRR